MDLRTAKELARDILIGALAGIASGLTITAIASTVVYCIR